MTPSQGPASGLTRVPCRSQQSESAQPSSRDFGCMSAVTTLHPILQWVAPLLWEGGAEVIHTHLGSAVGCAALAWGGCSHKSGQP